MLNKLMFCFMIGFGIGVFSKFGTDAGMFFVGGCCFGFCISLLYWLENRNDL